MRWVGDMYEAVNTLLKDEFIFSFAHVSLMSLFCFRYHQLESRVKQAEVYSRALLDNALRTQADIDHAFEGHTTISVY